MNATTVACLPERRREQLMDEAIQLLIAGKATQWAAGDKLNESTAGLTSAERARCFNAASSAAHQTTAYIRMLAQVSAAFPPEHRHEHVAWSLYRACVAAARRTKQSAPAVLGLALASGWHVPAVQALGRPAGACRSLDAKCPDCGGRIIFQMPGDASYPALPCPACITTRWADGGDGREAARLGVLA